MIIAAAAANIGAFGSFVKQERGVAPQNLAVGDGRCLRLGTVSGPLELLIQEVLDVTGDGT